MPEVAFCKTCLFKYLFLILSFGLSVMVSVSPLVMAVCWVDRWSLQKIDRWSLQMASSVATHPNRVWRARRILTNLDISVSFPSFLLFPQLSKNTKNEEFYSSISTMRSNRNYHFIVWSLIFTIFKMKNILRWEESVHDVADKILTVVKSHSQYLFLKLYFRKRRNSSSSMNHDIT